MLSELSRRQIIQKRQERTEKKAEPEKTVTKKVKKESIFAPESEAVTDGM